MPVTAPALEKGAWVRNLRLYGTQCVAVIQQEVPAEKLAGRASGRRIAGRSIHYDEFQRRSRTLLALTRSHHQQF